VGSGGEPEGTYLSRTLDMSLFFPRGALCCVALVSVFVRGGAHVVVRSGGGPGTRPRVWVHPTVIRFRFRPDGARFRFSSCRRVRYLEDECDILICVSSWTPGFHGSLATLVSRVRIAVVHFARFRRPRSGVFPVPGLSTGGAGGESRGSGGHPIALYTGSFFPLDAVPSGGRVPDLHRVPFSTEGHLLSSLLLPGCASLVAVFGTHLRIRISSFPFQRLPSRRSVPAGVVYTGWPFSRLDFILP
jgi:hypothetical protein